MVYYADHLEISPAGTLCEKKEIRLEEDITSVDEVMTSQIFWHDLKSGWRHFCVTNVVMVILNIVHFLSLLWQSPVLIIARLWFKGIPLFKDLVYYDDVIILFLWFTTNDMVSETIYYETKKAR